MSIYSEIKKYLLFLVGFFCVLLVGHIVLLYLYSDAIRYPLPGGTLNVGILGEKPMLNMMRYDTKIENDANDTVIKFLFRGILRFSTIENKVVNDLGTCSLETFPLVRCTLSQSAFWNDGSKVTSKDVIATYDFMKKHVKDEYTKSLLERLDVSEERDDLVFRFKTRNATNIQLLFLPIIREKDLQEEWSGDITNALSFNGPYILEQDWSRESTLLLRRNPQYVQASKPFFFDQIRLGFGTTNHDVYDSIDPDIFLSNTQEALKGVPNPYIRPIVYGAFLNSKKIPEALRKTLFYDVLKTLNISDTSIKPEDTIFLGEVPGHTPSPGENAFFQTVFSLGFSFGGTFQTPEASSSELIEKKHLTYINSPENQTPIFTANSTFEIRGSFPANTTRIIINDYTLKSFSAKKKSFSYTVKEEFGNIKAGKNVYRVSFYNGTKLLTEESVTIYYSSHKEELDSFRSQWEKENAPKPVPAVVLENLDPKKLYNRSGEVLSFRIVVPSEIPYLSQLGKTTAEKLQEFGAEAEVIELSMDEMKKNMSDPGFSYDIVFTGIHLGLFHYDISPFFHSQYIKSGLNISRIDNTSLDLLLNRLTERLYTSSPDKLREIEMSIQKIFEKELVFYPLGSPYEYFTIKDAVLGVKTPEFLVGREMLPEVISRGYLKEGYKRSSEPKTFISFFVWLKNVLFSTP